MTALISTPPQSFYAAMAELLSQKVNVGHTHAYASLTGLPDIPTITAQATIAAALTNAPADAKTDYNVVTTLLGAAVGGLNALGLKQNVIGNNLNDLAAKFNAMRQALIANGILAPA